VENKAPPPPPPPPLSFKQMPIIIVAIGNAMGKIFWVSFNAKGDAIKCVVLWNLWEFRATSCCYDGCAVYGMFKNLGQLQGGVVGWYAKPSVNNVIDI